MPNNTTTTLKTLFMHLHKKLEAVDLDSLTPEHQLLISEALGLCSQLSRIVGTLAGAIVGPETAAATSAIPAASLVAAAAAMPAAEASIALSVSVGPPPPGRAVVTPPTTPPLAVGKAATPTTPATPATQLSPPVPTVSSARVPTKNILVIDDDADIHKVLMFLLKRKGNFSVVSETNPAKALENLSGGGFPVLPDVILMDLMMPQMTGLDLLGRIRATPALSRIKIMIGSSRSYDKDRIAVLQAGANDFIAKPYNFDELLLRLTRLTA